MQKTNSINFIIVGHGLAGSALAMQLMLAGKTVLVIDKEKNISSKIAAGLFTPITGKLRSKTWNAEAVFELLHRFYPQIEGLTGQRFFYQIPVYRPFISVEEQNDWMIKRWENNQQTFIEKIHTSPSGWAGINDAWGGLLLRQTGYVHIPVFLEAVKEYLLQKNSYRCETFDYNQLQVNKTNIIYKDMHAQKIIFCEGVDTKHNPFFNWLPVGRLKGETLTISAELPQEVIFNRGIYTVPQGGNVFRVGATYERDDITEGITEKGKTELKEKINKLISKPYTILSQEWGIRPTAQDRRPIVGEHPVSKSVLVCNGMGTKGVSLAPYISNALTQFLITEKYNPIYTELDVSRYYYLYWKAKQHE